MNPFEMVLGIILIVTVGNVMKAKFGHRRRHGHEAAEYSVRDDAAASAENMRLKTELQQLKQRIQVLERVVTDNEGSLRLDREIEKLRDQRDD